MKEEYLGDGLYVSFDGWQYCLRAPRENGDHVVYLDGYTCKQFDEYRKNTERRLALSNGERHEGNH